jgi:hypothetical protein
MCAGNYGKRNIENHSEEEGFGQGCHNGRPTVKITVQTSARVHIYPADAVLLADGFLPSVDALMRPCGCAPASART